MQHGLDETAANEVVIALQRTGIQAVKARDESGEGVFVVTVPKSDVARAMELMRSLGLPRAARSGLAEMYGTASLVPSETEERARFLEALGNDIERTLETIEGVVSARVHIVLSESDPLAADDKPRIPAQAAALIKTRAGIDNPVKEADVQQLVGRSVPGLVPDAVAVVVTSAPEWTGEGKPILVSYGPISISPSSRTVLSGLLLGLLGLLAVLAFVLLMTARRLASVQRGAARRF